MEFHLPRPENIPSKLIIKNCEVWTPDFIYKNSDVLVHEGILSQIAPTGAKYPNYAEIPPSNAILLPLGVDVQAHLRIPGQKHKETAATGLYAALRGGYGGLLTMPNTNPVIDTPSICDVAMEEIHPIAEALGISVYLSAAMTLGQKGERAVNALELAQWGVKAFTDDGKGLASDLLMEELFKLSEKTGLPLLQHAEMPGHGGVLAPGTIQKKLGLKPYLPSPEVEMVRRDIQLLKKYPQAKYHVLHVSSAETIELVEKAKNDGLNITCEVCPHHLLLTSEDIKEDNSSFKMNPPLRTDKDRKILQKALESGVIDFISTDHAPHEPQAKTKDFQNAAFGTTGLETALKSLLYLHHEGCLSERRVVETFSSKPAQFLGIREEIGRLKIGEKFKGVIVSEKNKTRKINSTDLASLSKNNCFIGFPMPGEISTVFNSKGIFHFTN